MLHNFCKQQNCSDGEEPIGDVIQDTAGNLYGTASRGGKYNKGVVFRVSLGGVFAILHDFNGAYEPDAGLTYSGQAQGARWDGSSPLYGVTTYGGQYGNGVVYQLVHSGSTWTYSVIHAFNSSSYPNPLTMDAAGNLFGTTTERGKYGGGLMFKLAAETWKETLLYSFCSETNCHDGKAPAGRLAIDSGGKLFGVTTTGGTNVCFTGDGCGVVFEYASGDYSVLYNLCSRKNCADGMWPVGGPVLDGAGHLLGTTRGDESAGYSHGTIYELTNNSGTWSHTTLSTSSAASWAAQMAHFLMARRP